MTVLRCLIGVVIQGQTRSGGVISGDLNKPAVSIGFSAYQQRREDNSVSCVEFKLHRSTTTIVDVFSNRYI